MEDYPETHQQGTISLDNKVAIDLLFDGTNYLEADFGVQIAKDGRIWLCINKIPFVRFKPFVKQKKKSIEISKKGREAAERRRKLLECEIDER